MSGEEVRLPLTAVAHPARPFARSMTSLRLARGWSVPRLAAEAGVSEGVIYRMEAGRGGCQLETAWLIAEALEASLDAMIRGEVPR